MEKKHDTARMTPAFLRLLLAKMESPKTNTKEFVQLSKVYAGIIAGKKPKKDKRVKEANPAPAVMLTETEQILAIEAKRNSNGTR